MFWGEHGPHSLNVPFFMAMEGFEEVVATAGYTGRRQAHWCITSSIVQVEWN
jgi:hypothetical protein